ncbi:MAG: PspC domain-containing protein [Anaerolineae bacterium]|nr:PspC domain-containing protein [Anaerolineae bacterium]
MRRLYRSRDERMIAGVAGGLAHYFNVDPTLVRLAFVAFTLGGGGIGLLAYLILAIIMPLEPMPGMEEMRAPGAAYTHMEPSEETRRELRETRIPEVER